MPTQVLSGLLPIALHPDPKDVAVIGWERGHAGCCARCPCRASRFD